MLSKTNKQKQNKQKKKLGTNEKAFLGKSQYRGKWMNVNNNKYVKKEKK